MNLFEFMADTEHANYRFILDTVYASLQIFTLLIMTVPHLSANIQI